MSAAIESLRAFAMQHGELQFAHLCTAALNGEAWAMERVEYSLDGFDRSTSDAWKLRIIRATDCIRPDGATPRGGIEVRHA
jgi:hypothetical protein